MRTPLRLAALFVCLVTVVLWFFGGPNLGWTKTTVPIERRDEVLGQSYTVWEKRFLPGVDFLGAGLTAGLVLFGLSFLLRKSASRD